MTGPELRALRERHGLSRRQFGLLLGYQGQPGLSVTQVYRLEAGNQAIRPALEHLIRLIFPEPHTQEK